jgi:hypothetical protein
MRIRALGVALVVGLTSCGGAATDGPTDSEAPYFTPTSTRRPTPEPTPIDIVGIFATQMTAAATLRAELSGELTVGERTGVVTGLYEADTDGNRNLTHVVFSDGAEVETETISIGDMIYTRDGTQWIRSTRSVGGSGGDNLDDVIQAAIKDPGQLVLAGVVRLGGVRLQRVELASRPAITAAMVGITDPDVSDFSANLAFLAQEAGTPEGMLLDLSWNQPIADETVAAALRLEYRFDLGAEVAVAAPDDAYEVHTSPELGYRMRHPVGWSVRHQSGDAESWPTDVYLGRVDDEVQVFRQGVEGEVPAEVWFRWAAESVVEHRGVEPEVAAEMFLGDLRVRVLHLHIVEDGTEYFYQMATIFGGHEAWDLFWYSRPGSEEDDGVRFMTMVLSFERAG